MERKCPICGGPMGATDIEVCSRVCAGKKSWRIRLEEKLQLTWVEWALIGGLVLLIGGFFIFWIR